MALLQMIGFSWFCALFFELVLLIPGADAQSWSCVTAEQCALSLERDFNETLANKNDSHVIDFCLKKTKEFRTVCLIKAVIECEWGGNEAEYYRLQNIQKSFQLKCSELCPVMEEIKACSGLVKYNLYITKKFQEFCNSYKESVRCKENALMVDSNCTFGEKLYVQDFEADTLRVFKYICDSGCEDIDRTWAVLERCTSTYNLNNADSGCKTYRDLERCLSVSNSCPQIHMMAPYFARNYTEYMMRCPLPMPVKPITAAPTVLIEPKTTENAKQEKETIMDSETVKNLTPNQYMPIQTTDLLHKDNVQSSSSTESNTVSGVRECLTNLDPPLDSADNDYCESIRCLRNNGFDKKNVVSLNIQKSQEQQLIDKWESCEGKDESSIETSTRYVSLYDTSVSRKRLMSSTELQTFLNENKTPINLQYSGKTKSMVFSSKFMSTTKVAKISENINEMKENTRDMNTEQKLNSVSTVDPVLFELRTTEKVFADLTDDSEIAQKLNSRSTVNPDLSDLRSTEKVFPELSDDFEIAQKFNSLSTVNSDLSELRSTEKIFQELSDDSEMDSSTSGRITNRHTTNPKPKVTSLQHLERSSISFLKYESATPSIEIKIQQISTSPGRNKPVLSQGLNNGAFMKDATVFVLLITAMTSSRIVI